MQQKQSKRKQSVEPPTPTSTRSWAFESSCCRSSFHFFLNLCRLRHYGWSVCVCNLMLWRSTLSSPPLFLTGGKDHILYKAAPRSLRYREADKIAGLHVYCTAVSIKSQRQSLRYRYRPPAFAWPPSPHPQKWTLPSLSPLPCPVSRRTGRTLSRGR